MPDTPVEVIDTGSEHGDPAKPEPGMASARSGGGYRAMLFHLGAMWRLYEAGLLKGLKRISSVSGGSIGGSSRSSRDGWLLQVNSVTGAPVPPQHLSTKLTGGNHDQE